MNRYCEQVSSTRKESTYFTWKIENFLPSEAEVEEFIESSTIQCLDTSWRLRVYPNGRHYHDPGHVIVGLVKVSSTARRLSFKIGFKNRYGCECFSIEKEKELISRMNESCYQQSIPQDTLCTAAEDLLPNNTLTAFCELKVNSVIHGRVTEKKCASGSLHLDTNFTNAFLNSALSDVTLKVGKAAFPAHKVILASRSKVFQGMFESGMKESQENVIDLVEMQQATAENMLQYIYTGCIKELTMESAFDLYVAADRYDLEDLVVCCQDFILKNISSEYICEVAALANVHSDEMLAMASKLCLKENFKLVLKSEKWRLFAKNHPDLYTELLENAVLIDKQDL